MATVFPTRYNCAGMWRIGDFPIGCRTKVRITNGAFSGVEGQIKRIHKKVLVCVEGISSVMLNFVPKNLLEIIPDGKDCNKPSVL